MQETDERQERKALHYLRSAGKMNEQYFRAERIPTKESR